MPQDTFDKNGITLHAKDLMQQSGSFDVAKTRAKTIYTFRDVPNGTPRTQAPWSVVDSRCVRHSHGREICGLCVVL